ncbi:hypothetical protein PAECIP111802_06971 [Paenibacillus allorhizosphaerae]|uniref:Uncharacterized protein n=1 Tax=Paenibacillus allorhizosphaerae TaxID=2849866 RepID=A0ABM8VTU0_9BACL|nr:hypothetical protein PAECIP111802_06971 [Paenibacillus allorhizosphaerae]
MSRVIQKQQALVLSPYIEIKSRTIYYAMCALPDSNRHYIAVVIARHFHITERSAPSQAFQRYQTHITSAFTLFFVLLKLSYNYKTKYVNKSCATSDHYYLVVK